MTSETPRARTDRLPRPLRVVNEKSNQRRIERSPLPPEPWPLTDGRPPKAVDLGIGYDVFATRTGWRFVCDASEIKQRATEIRVMDDDRLRGVIRTLEFRLEPFSLTRFQFFQIMDGESDEAQRLAEVVLSCWVDPFFDLSDYGSLLLVDYAWSPIDAREPVWAQALEKALPRLYADAAGMFALAFPTQYAGNVPGACPARQGFNRRRMAMLRHYKRILNLSPLPGWAGSKGWVWRMLNTDVLDPEQNSDVQDYDASDEDDD